MLDAVSRDTFADRVVEASREQPVLVDCWGPRCGPCLKLMPWVEKLADEVAGRVGVVKLNTSENRRLAAELRVMGLPTFLLFSHGREVERLTGDDCTPKGILALLEPYLGSAALSAAAD